MIQKDMSKSKIMLKNIMFWLQKVSQNNVTVYQVSKFKYLLENTFLDLYKPPTKYMSMSMYMCMYIYIILTPCN